MQTEIILEADQISMTKEDLVDLYETYSPRLFAYAFRLLGDSQLAEDCVSETFSRFLSVIQRGVGPMDNIKAYLYRISHNWIMDYYRNRPPEATEIKIEQLQSNSDEPEGTISQKMEQERVREALLNLPENQRQVVLLRFYDNWTHEETATFLGKSEEATRALQYRAMEALRNKLVPAQGRGTA